MEKFTFDYPVTKKLVNHAHIGVAGSGDLEILVQPCELEDTARVIVRTSVDGFKQIWKDVLDRFFTVNNYAVSIHINDFGATPGVVSLRLAQAFEVLQS